MPTVLELAILGLLKEQELHGYELKRRLSDTLGLLASVSFGSLYPALARLESSGAVVALLPGPPEGSPPPAGPRPGTPEARIPMTGSLAGERAAYGLARSAGSPPGTFPARSPRRSRDRRVRKVYAITPAGLALFESLLAGEEGPRDAEDDRSFALRLAFARHLSPEARLRLLERRRMVLALRRDKLVARSRPPDAYRAALAQHRAEILEGDIAWIERLIDTERRRAGPATRHSIPLVSLSAARPRALTQKG
jgi:DNA-binding PadR family transcriptional regulator